MLLGWYVTSDVLGARQVLYPSDHLLGETTRNRRIRVALRTFGTLGEMVLAIKDFPRKATRWAIDSHTNYTLWSNLRFLSFEKKRNVFPTNLSDPTFNLVWRIILKGISIQCLNAPLDINDALTENDKSLRFREISNLNIILMLWLFWNYFWRKKFKR